MDASNNPSQSSAAEMPSTPQALVVMEAFDCVSTGSTGYLIMHEDGSMLTRDEATHILTLVTDHYGLLRIAPPPIVSL